MIKCLHCYEDDKVQMEDLFRLTVEG